MEITKNFKGGNIEVTDIKGNDVFVNREVRDGTGYFYWAFCVKNAGGKKLRFIFPYHTRVGRFGAAVSHDFKNWQWSFSKETVNEGDAFTYEFKEDENCVYFAHDMVYSEDKLRDFLKENNIEAETFTITKKGREVPSFTIGEGEKIVVVTSRHHACESTGTCVLHGFAEGCIENPIAGIKFLFVPFVDFDGVTDGDPGKNRLPYDHNRDYGEAPAIYNETAKLRELVENNQVLMNFDFHSPHHDGGINDYPYIMKIPANENNVYERISKYLKEATAKDADSLTYTSNEDLKYGSQWNMSDTPNVKNYFLKRTILKSAITMETPYFGLDDNMFTQEKAMRMGKHLYSAVYEILKEL